MEKLFKSLSEQGKYTKSFEDFQTQFGSKEGQEKLYGALESTGDYTKSFEDFSGQFFSSDVAKTNDSASADPAVESNQNSMDSASENGSSGFLSKAVSVLKKMSPVYDMIEAGIDGVVDSTKAIKDSESNEAAPDNPSKTYSIVRGVKENPKGFFGNAIEGIPGAVNTVAKILVDDLIVDGRETLLTLGMEGYNYLDKGRSATPEEKEIIAASAKATNTYLDNIIAITAPQLTRKGVSKITEKLNEHITVHDNTISEEILKGSKADWGEVGGRIFAGALTSSPYTLAALNPYTAAALGFAISNDKFVEEYEKNPDKELWKITGNAATTGGIEMIDSLISRRMFRAKGLLKGKNFKGNAEKALNEMNKGIGRKIMDVVGLGGKESLTEMGQSIATKINDELWLGDSNNISEVYENSKSKIMEDAFEIIDEGIIGGFSGGGIAGIASATRGNATLKARAEFLLMPASERKTQKELFKKIVEKNNQIKLAKEGGNQKKADVLQGLNNDLKKKLQTISIKNQMVLDNLQGKDLMDYAKNVDKINILKEGKNAQDVKNDINNLINENQTIFDKVLKENFGDNMAFTKAAAAKLNISEGLQILNSDSSYEQAIANSLGFKTFEEYIDAVYAKRVKQTPTVTRGDVERSLKGSNGVFIGKGGILINSKQSKKLGAIGVGSHEVLHSILSALVGNAKAQKSVVQGFEKELSKEQAVWVKQELKKQGKVEGTQEYYNEYITVFSEGLVKNRINFERNSFGKIKDWVTKTFINKGFDNIDFVSGRGVYNFMKSYSESVKSGNLSEKTTEAIAKREKETGVKVSEAEAVSNEEQFSKTITEAEAALDAAMDADPDNPSYLDNIDKAERELDEAEAAAKAPPAVVPEIKKEVKPKEKIARPEKPTRTTDLGPRDPISKKIMSTYNEDMEGVDRPEYKANKPLPASLERKLIPLFEGYINTIVQQKFKQASPEALEFQDALSILRAEVSNAIRTFNPAKNKDLAGYVKKIVQTRQSLMFKDANQEFTSDIEGDAAKGVVATEDEVSVDRSGAVERGQATFDQLEVVDDALLEDISKELEKEIRVRTQKGTLSESRKVTQKVKGKSYETLVPWIEDYVEKTLFKKLSKKLGAVGQTKDKVTGEQKTRIPGPYIDFLNDKNTFDIITKALPIKVLKSNYSKLFKVTKIGREKTAEGNPIFRVEPTTPKAFLQYFLDGNYGTLLARQKQLFREILRPVAKEVVADYATVENISELKSIQELAPETSIDIANTIALEAQLNNLESILDKYKDEQASFDVIQFSKGLKEAFGLDKDQVDFTSKDQIKSGRAGLVKLFRSFKKEGFSAEMVANMFIGTARGSYGLLGKKYVTIKNGNLLKVYDLETKKWRTNRFLLTGTTDFFNLLKKVYNNVDYKKGRTKFEQDGKEIELNKVPSQSPKGFVNGSMFSGGEVASRYSILDRKAYSRKQRLNLKNIIEELTKAYNDKYLTDNQVAMILGTLASSTNGLIRTAAMLTGYSKQLLKNTLMIDDSFRFEHSQAASFTVTQLAKLITDKNYPHTFDQIMEGFNVFIIPKAYDTAIGSVPSFISKGPVDSKGYMILSTPEYVARYQDPRAVKAIEEAGLPPLDLILFSKSEGSSVDIYHGGNIQKTGDINGIVYFSEDKAQAAEYAKGNYGEVKNFVIKAENVVSEEKVFEVIEKLGIQPKTKGYKVDELHLYELIDPRFEQESFSKKDLAKLTKALKKKGIKASKFTDTDLQTGEYTSNIVVFDKSVIQESDIQFSKGMNEVFNDMIEGATGIETYKRFSKAKGKVRGRNKGRFKFFIPPSADDFAGLLYRLLGKKEQGNLDSAWFKEKLFDPFAKGIRDFEAYKQRATKIVAKLKKDIKNIPSGLSKINETGFTNEQAVRVYLWVKNGHDIDGLTATDQKELIKIVNDNPALKRFAEEVDIALQGYPEPSKEWLAGTITTDAINMVNTAKRAEFLKEWQANADLIFSEQNLNKLRAAYGDNYVEALQDMLYRMKTGRNRPSGANKLTNKFMNWVNDSVGTIMFFNTRSALLQTLSIANFINWGDNNPAKAAMAFANQKQFWADFTMLFNSDFLKQRRSGLKTDVNADDIASAAETSTNKAKAVLASLLKMGFLPTQMADSFAIAMGGASFIRNRINALKKEGMTEAEATDKAFLDFQEIAEETQQSSRPDRISQQQASPLGRIILAFANTPMQYMRLTKKAFLDLKNGRGDKRTNISKIAYYMFVQNIIFSALQTALFSALFDDDEEELDNKEIRIANSMLDSILRGVGVYGAIASTGKNIYLEIDRQSKKPKPDFTQAAIRSLDLSPPISAKIRKLMSAGRAFSFKTTREKMVGFNLDNPAIYAGGQVVSALTNIPLDRVIKKADNLRTAVDNDTKFWQSVALALGYSKWDLGLVETSKTKGKKSKFGVPSSWKRPAKKRKFKRGE